MFAWRMNRRGNLFGPYYGLPTNLRSVLVGLIAKRISVRFYGRYFHRRS
jgi:hypothetical protein